MLVDLPFEKEPFKILKGEVVEFEDGEIALDPPGIFILLEFRFGNFAPKVADDLVEQTGDVEREEVDTLVEDGGASEIMYTHEL